MVAAGRIRPGAGRPIDEFVPVPHSRVFRQMGFQVATAEQLHQECGPGHLEQVPWPERIWPSHEPPGRVGDLYFNCYD